MGASCAPHLSQNFAACRLSVPHFAQRIGPIIAHQDGGRRSRSCSRTPGGQPSAVSADRTDAQVCDDLKDVESDRGDGPRFVLQLIDGAVDYLFNSIVERREPILIFGRR